MTHADVLQHAIDLRSQEQYSQAETIIVQLHQQTPNDPLVNYHMAWLCDVQEKEREAIPYYEKAIQNGLSGDDLRGALLGLGSTYRTLGEYENSRITLEKGRDAFPDAPEFTVFLAMTHYNLGESKYAVQDLLKLLLQVTDDASIQRFSRAIALYAEDLDQTWDQ